jgi:PHP family Zn ribbon phosphoesterase
VPLLEILAEVQETTPSSQKVLQNYHFLTDDLGSELAILLKLPLEKIAAVAGTRVAEGIKKVRAGEIFISPGYDGQYGIVKVWGETETAPKNDQMSLF